MWMLPLLPFLLAAQADVREKARELLDGAAQVLSTTPPDLQVDGLIRVAECYQELDKQKAVELMRQAFAGTAALPEDSDRGFRCRMQADIIGKTAAMSQPEAIEMLRGMAEPVKDPETRARAADRVVQVLLEKSDFERIFEKLPKEDARRLLVFGNAADAWKHSASGAFPRMVARHWREVPPQMAQAAVESVVTAILARKDDTSASESLSAGDKSVRLKSRHSRELFDIMPPLRALDPQRAAGLMAKYTDLPAAVERFPGGRQEATGFGTEQADGSSSWHVSSTSGDDEDIDVGMARIAVLFSGDFSQKSTDRAQKESERLSAVLAEKDARKALDMASSISVPAVRAIALGKSRARWGARTPPRRGACCRNACR